MPSHRTFVVAIAAALAVSPVTAQQQPTVAAQPAQSESKAPHSTETLLAAAFRLADSEKYDAARTAFNETLARAVSEKNRAAEAEAHRGLGIVSYEQSNYATARSEYDQALAIVSETGNQYQIARVEQHLGSLAIMMGNQREAQEFYRNALAVFRQLGARKELARLLDNYAFLNISTKEKQQVINEALQLSQELGDKRQQGRCLHHRSDIEYSIGDSIDAMNDLYQAADLLQEVGARENFSRVLTSLGRLHLAYGQLDEAIATYQQALKIETELGDKEGVMQLLNGIAEVRAKQHNFVESRRYYQQALDVARATGSPRLIGFELANLSTSYSVDGQYDKAKGVLEEALKLQESSFNEVAWRYFQLAQNYRFLGKLPEALSAANKSIEEAREHTDVDYLLGALPERALIWQRLGNQVNALVDIHDALDLTEQMRTKLAPQDFLKRGFAERYQSLFSFAIEVLWQHRRYQEALEVAERGRARAFLDLLATRERELQSVSETVAAQQNAPVHLPDHQTTLASFLTDLRGPPTLPSAALGHAATMSEIRATARQLHSTILEYWVAPNSTFVWIIGYDGRLRARQLAVGAHRLEFLARSLWGTGHSDTTLNMAGRSGRGSRLGGIALTKRGGETIVLDSNSHWRSLYDELIRPVEAWLPNTPGALLTIVPHGPLFQVPFAGLNDGKTYLVERYTTYYAPSISVLRSTVSRKRVGHSNSALLVADPSLPPALRKLGLSPLPAARHEVELVRAALGPGSIVLVGEAASKQKVHELIAGKRIVHIATHGIVRNDDPMQSFLAFAEAPSASDSSGKDDGLLTAKDVYDLKIDADLVFLSACRSGMGQISGDGVIGLTRPFLYAGTQTVIATLSDIADEPSYLLVGSFYRSWRRNHRAAAALRSAQLNLLHDLRANKVTVRGPSAIVQLPETPSLWAGFVVIGNPE